MNNFEFFEYGVSECVFRTLPEPDPYDDLAELPVFGVGPDDLFPEEFRSFLGLPAPLRKLFESHHDELFASGYWTEIQRRIESGEIIEVLPYSEEDKLRGSAASGIS